MPSQSFPMIAPVGGLRTDFPEDNMPTGTALVFDNVVSDGKKVFARGGSEQYSDLATAAPVDTMAQWVWQGNAILLAASGGQIFDVSIGSTPVSLGSGFVSSQWQWDQQNNFTIFVNGTDPSQKFDGTTLTAWAPTFAGGSITSADIQVIGTYKERVFGGQKNSLSVWYGGPQNIEGTFNVFPLDSVANKGGVLVAIGTYSADTGSGPDDFILFFTSEGEMIAYTGLDPGNAATWSLVGVYELPRPIGLRAFHKPKTSNGVIITEHGYLRVEEIISAVPRNQRRGVAVENAILEAHRKFEPNFGWDIVDFSHADWVLANVPDDVGSTKFVQYVIHGSGAWSRFFNWDGRSWIEWEDRLFYGANDGKVIECDIGFADLGDQLQFDVKTSYEYYGNRALRKRFYGVRIVYRSLGNFPITIDWDVDFEDKAPPYQSNSNPATTTPWGSPWGSPWSSSSTLVKFWRGVRGEGYAGSLRLRGSTIAQPFEWQSWEPLFEYGTPR